MYARQFALLTVISWSEEHVRSRASESYCSTKWSFKIHMLTLWHMLVRCLATSKDFILPVLQWKLLPKASISWNSRKFAPSIVFRYMVVYMFHCSINVVNFAESPPNHTQAPKLVSAVNKLTTFAFVFFFHQQMAHLIVNSLSVHIVHLIVVFVGGTDIWIIPPKVNVWPLNAAYSLAKVWFQISPTKW